jgi:transcriptional regulator with GAF, ATPase, and Fis domain
LDEIGEMPIELQAKLLRVLETSEYIQIGDTTPKVEFRLIAATNRDLKPKVKNTVFVPICI